MDEANANPIGSAALISADPPIVLASWGAKLSFVEALGLRCRDRSVTFLLKSVWHCDEACAAKKVAAAREFSTRLPMHRIIFCGNTQEEVDHLTAAGLDAFFMNHNIWVPEAVFHPLPNVAVEFDALYNARPLPEKRHALAAEIDRIAYVCAVGEREPEHARKIVAELLARGAGHVLINKIADGIPGWMHKSAVNKALARAAVGLCLSEVEGAMNASIEYLAAGLPIVSTPSLGGRHVFFDPDYCMIADANPRAIRQAVEALRERNIPRDYVRARTLAKLEPERHRFLAFVEEIRARSGVPRAYATEWKYSGASPLQWGSVDQHARILRQKLRSVHCPPWRPL